MGMEGLTKWMPLARYGEIDYCCIARSRSGQDAGELEYLIRVDAIARLSKKEKAKLLRVAEAMLTQVKRHCGADDVPDYGVVPSPWNRPLKG